MARGTLSEESLRRLAERQVDRLLEDHPDHEARLAQISRRGTRWRSPHLVEVLLERCLAAGRSRPTLAKQLAELAEAVFLRVRQASKGETRRGLDMTEIKDLRALVEAHKGNAARLAERLEQASRHFRTAWSLLAPRRERAAARAPRTLARVGSLYGSLLTELMQDPQAARVLRFAANQARAAGDTQLQAKILLQLQASYGYMEKARQALGALREAWRILDRQQADGHLAVIVINNYALELCNVEEYREAETVLRKGARFFDAGQPASILLRRTLTEGRIHQGLGRFFDARRCYTSAREGLMARGKVLEALQVSMDLAGLYIQQGSAEQVRGVASEIAVLMEHEQVRPALHEEGRLALRRFLDAAARREATEDLRLVAVAALTGRRAGGRS